MCEEWARDFESFERDMGQPPSSRHQLDRINNDGPYIPGNCRWATKQEQANNRRTNVRLTFNGETKNLIEWARLYGMSLHRLWHRINTLHWPIEQALTLKRYDSPRKRA